MIEDALTESVEELMVIGDWAVCRSVTARTITYGEHIKGCLQTYRKGIATWSWEAQDSQYEERVGKGGVGLCWGCKAPVPKEIIALVALANWDDNRGTL